MGIGTGRFSDGQKSGEATFLRGLASKTGLDFFEIVGPFWMRSVISDAHPPGGLLLPLCGNSPCVVENDGLRFIPPPAGGGTLRGFFPAGEFFDTLDGEPLGERHCFGLCTFFTKDEERKKIFFKKQTKNY